VGGTDTCLTAGLESTTPYNQTTITWSGTPGGSPNIAVALPNGQDFGTAVDLGVPSYFGPNPTPLPVLYTVTQPIKGDKGCVSGQYALTWSRAYVDGQYVGQLERVSPSSGSLAVLYEAGRISSSLNWDYTGSSVEQTFTEVDGWSAYSDAFSWITARGSFEVVKGFKIYLEGKNLANAIARSYLNQRSDAVWSASNTGSSSSLGQGYTAYGRSYMAGLTYRF